MRLVFFKEKANAIFRLKKKKNPDAQSCREAKNLQLCAARIFYFGPCQVALDLQVDVINEIRQPNHPRDVPGSCMSPILQGFISLHNRDKFRFSVPENGSWS